VLPCSCVRRLQARALACAGLTLSACSRPYLKAAQTLDFTQPVAVMLLAILHYIPDLAEVQRIVARLITAVPSGSYLVISHAASDISAEAMAEMIRRMNEHLAEGNHVGRRRSQAVSQPPGSG
jgi:hypothetical protein